MNNKIKSKKPVFGVMQTKNTLNAEYSAPPLYIEARHRNNYRGAVNNPHRKQVE